MVVISFGSRGLVNPDHNWFFPYALELPLDSLHSNTSTPGNELAITFDDGPHPEFTPKVLQLLEKYDAKATFFALDSILKNTLQYSKRLFPKVM